MVAIPNWREMNAKHFAILTVICVSCEAEYNSFAVVSNTIVSDSALVRMADTTATVLNESESLDFEDSIWEAQVGFTPLDSQSVPLKLSPKLTYDWWKGYFLRKRESLKVKYIAAENDSGRIAVLAEAEDCLLTNMVNGLIPHWYGTPWDFEGHTDIPGEGEIACGYFVSTTLVHAGFNLNRYRLAQQSAYSEIKTLQTTGSMHKLINKELTDLIAFAKSNLEEGLYVIGLDFHVGYLLKWKSEVYFLHSKLLVSE